MESICGACKQPFPAKSWLDKFCDGCDERAATAWEAGVSIDEILAWYPASLAALRANAVMRRKRRSYLCQVCGNPSPKKGVCPRCRSAVVASVADIGTGRTARRYHLSPTSVREYVKEYLGD